MNEKKLYLATSIYDRLEANARNESGTVEDDLEEVLAAGDLTAFEDYFGDLDPFEFL